MSERMLMKGCEAIAEAAVRAGCRFFAGYPITPQNEIPEYLSRRMPEVDGVFIQGESEVAAINMVLGASCAGVRSMTSSSGPGISLKGEGLSTGAIARSPLVCVNISRGGPGLGVIQPAQADYFQATKAAGHGGFQMMVFAPESVQEAVNMTYAAFDFADRDRNPVLILADGAIGAMMEPVILPEPKTEAEIEAIQKSKYEWALVGHPTDEKASMIQTFRWTTAEMQVVNEDLAALYASWVNDVQVEEYLVDDAEYIITSYGISARAARSAIRQVRAEGLKVGMIRPKTISPFPYGIFKKLDYKKVKGILNVEMSIPAQFGLDVEFGAAEQCPVRHCLCGGGNLMSITAVVRSLKEMIAELEGK